MDKTIKRSPISRHMEMSTIFEYKKTKKYPQGMVESEKRNLRKRAKSFEIQGDQMYFIPSEVTSEVGDETEEAENAESQSNKRLVLRTVDERLAAIAVAHVDAKGTHLGREKVSNLITEKYYWVGISSLVRDFIKRCAKCQTTRFAIGTVMPSTGISFMSLSTNQLESVDEEDFNEAEVGSTFSTTSLSSTTVPSQEDAMQVIKMEYLPEPLCFWETVEMCVFGPYLADDKDHYIVMVIDAYSHWPEAFIVENVDTSVITQIILSLVCRFGQMQTFVLRDTNGYSKDRLYPSLEALTGVNLDISVKQTGCLETYGVWQEISQSVQNFVVNNQDWMACLEFALLPHRISRGDRADYTPAYLTYGRELCIPDKLSCQKSTEFSNVDPHLSPNQMKTITAHLMNAFHVHSSELNIDQSEPTSPNCSHDGGMETEEYTFKVPSTTKKRGRRSTKTIKSETEDNDDKEWHSSESRSSSVTRTTRNDETEPSTTGVLTSVPHRRKRKLNYTELGKGNDNADVEKANYNADSKYDMDLSEEMFIDEDDCLEHNYANSSSVLEKVNIDMFYEGVKLYITKKKYLPHSHEYFKRVIRHAYTKYKVIEDVLYFDVGKCLKEVPETFKDRMKLMLKFHVDSKGVHHAKRYMVDRLSRKYIWKGFTLDCEAFVQACPNCKLGKIGKSTEVEAEAQDKKLINYREGEEWLAKDAENLYGELFTYLQREIFPHNCDKMDIKSVKKLAKKFTLDNDNLYFTRDKNTERRYLALSSRERRKAVKEAHNLELHLGMNETLEQLSLHYLWWGMKNDVETFVRNCCNKNVPDPKAKSTVLKKRCMLFKKYLLENKTTAFENQMEIDEAPQEEVSSINDSDGRVENIKYKSSNMKDSSDKENREKTDSQENGQETVQENSEQETVQENSEQETVQVSDTGLLMECHNSDKSSIHQVNNTDIISESNSVGSSDSGIEKMTKEIPISSITVQSTEQGNVFVVESDMERDEIQILTSDTTDSQSHSYQSENPDVIESNGSAQINHLPIVEQGSESSDYILEQNEKILKSVSESASDNALENENLISIPSTSDDLIQTIMPSSDHVIQTITSSSDRVTAVAVNSILPESEQVHIPVIIETNNEREFEQSAEVQQILDIQPENVQPTIESDDNFSDQDEDDEDISGSEEDDDKGNDEKLEENVTGGITLPTDRRGPTAYKCQICNKRIRGSVKFKVHMYQHTGVKPYECPYCKKRFTNPKSLKHHSRKHTGDKPYLCNICGKGFTITGSLRAHIKIHEKGGNIQVRCTLCDRTFSSQNRYDRHMAYKHPPIPLVFSCEPCNKTFTTARSLKRHNLSHHLKEKNHQCHICGKQFYRKEYLISHQVLQHEQQGTTPRRARRPATNRQPRHPKPQIPVQNEMQLSYSVAQGVVDPQISVAQAVYDHELEGGYYTITTEQGEDDQPVTTLVYNYPAVEYEVECGSSATEPIDTEALSAINILAQASANQGY